MNVERIFTLWLDRDDVDCLVRATFDILRHGNATELLGDIEANVGGKWIALSTLGLSKREIEAIEGELSEQALSDDAEEHIERSCA